MDRSREKFLPDLFTKLNQYGEHQSGSGLYGSPPFCVHRVKVTFVNEPGEGSGVLRSLFTAMAEVSGRGMVGGATLNVCGMIWWSHLKICGHPPKKFSEV